jgi:hypothetical protein
VLEPMVGLVPNLYLFGPQRTQAGSWGTGMQHLATWADVEHELLGPSAQGSSHLSCSDLT